MLKNIFITSIWDVNLNFNLDSLKKEINEITKEDEGRIVSNQGGYQSKNIDIQKYTHINFLSQAILTNSDSCIPRVEANLIIINNDSSPCVVTD